MKECPKCKTMMEDDALFCGECGTKFEVEEIDDQVEETLAPSEKKCIHCGETIEEDSAFCPYCGKSQEVEDVKEVEPQDEELKPEEKPVAEEKTESKETPAQEAPEEQTTYEWEEEKKSKRWIWILLTILLIGAGAWYFFSQDDYLIGGNETMPETVDTDSIEEPDETEEYEEITPTSPLAFLEQFYKSDYKNEEYIKQHVTANVINKLKRDYDYECPSGDCLATWVFTAYPAGADLELEEGPIISETQVNGKFKVDFRYSGYNGEQKQYHKNSLFLTVTEIDGRYLISDYEQVIPDMEQNQDDMPNYDEEYESQKMGTGEDMHTTQAKSTQEKQQHSAFFVFGTTAELKEFGILDNGGTLRPNFDKNYFTKIDTRVDKVIKLYSMSAKILTPHPSNSYTLMTNEHNQYELSITDPERFWSSSKYLVILVK